MRYPTGKRLAVPCIVATLLSGALGCAHNSSAPTPPSPEVRSNLGSIGVTWNGSTPSLSYLAVARGPEEGAKRGAAAGAASDPQHGEAIADRMQRLAQAQAGLRAARLHVPDPTGQDIALEYYSLGYDSVETILELSELRLLLEGTDLSGDINPSLRLKASLSVRLMRRADGMELHRYLAEYQGDTHTFTGWGAHDARAFREELHRASQTLAQGAVDHLFLSVAPLPAGA